MDDLIALAKACAEIQQRCEAATEGPWESAAGAIYSAREAGGRVILAASASAECGRKGDYYECGSPTAICHFHLHPYDNAFIAHARTDIPYLLQAITALVERAEKAERLVYVPGVWKCAKCNFRLVQANLNANTGTVTARDEPGDKCPNCASPLRRVTWKDEAEENLTIGEQQVARAVAAEKCRADLLAALQDVEQALRTDSRDKSIAGDTVEYHLDGQTMYHAIERARAATATAQPSREE